MITRPGVPPSQHGSLPMQCVARLRSEYADRLKASGRNGVLDTKSSASHSDANSNSLISPVFELSVTQAVWKYLICGSMP